MSARIYTLPSPRVRRALVELVEIGFLAIDVYRLGDRECLADCERWHHARLDIIRDEARRQRQLLAANGAPVAEPRTRRPHLVLVPPPVEVSDG